MINLWRCLVCGREVRRHELSAHKKIHQSMAHYGFMWPICEKEIQINHPWPIPIHTSEHLADLLKVGKVYVRDEGMNPSGSMKDYMVRQAVEMGLRDNFDSFTVVSSGNHAASLAFYASRCHAKTVVFTPASSSKIAFLSNLPYTKIVSVKDAIFEDVYMLANTAQLESLYNANVSNEELLTVFRVVAESLNRLNPLPTHILSGVGNGSYLAGITYGFERMGTKMPKIIPVGMKGAFPTKEAFRKDQLICEYERFNVDECLIDAAEGSIAIASYSMPQLIHALKISDGFPLGDITNEDLRRAYLALWEDKSLLENGAIPEPTGIMGLAAAIKHEAKFSSNDVLLLAFTGSGVKDHEGIRKLVPEIADELLAMANKFHPNLSSASGPINQDNVTYVSKDISPDELNLIISRLIE
jgi:threonine synthase